MQVFNDGNGEGDVLNFGCGADFVKVQQKCPRNLESVQPLERCVSVGATFVLFGIILRDSSQGDSRKL